MSARPDPKAEAVYSFWAAVRLVMDDRQDELVPIFEDINEGRCDLGTFLSYSIGTVAGLIEMISGSSGVDRDLIIQSLCLQAHLAYEPPEKQQKT